MTSFLQLSTSNKLAFLGVLISLISLLFTVIITTFSTNTIKLIDNKTHQPELCEIALNDSYLYSIDKDLSKELKENQGKLVDYKDGITFNKCIERNQKKIIELSVWLDEKRKIDAEQYLMTNKQIYFHVSDMFEYNPRQHDKDYIYGHGGHEYLVSLGGKDTDTTFITTPPRLVTLSGYFKVSSIIGPFQGAMSVHLKGVRIEDIN